MSDLDMHTRTTPSQAEWIGLVMVFVAFAWAISLMSEPSGQDVQGKSSDPADYPSSYYCMGRDPICDNPNPLPPLDYPLHLDVVVHPGSSVWQQADRFVTDLYDGWCLSPVRHEIEVASIVDQLQTQYERNLNLVYPGERFVLDTPVVRKNDTVCQPKMPQEAPYYYGGDNEGSLPPMQSNRPALPSTEYVPPSTNPGF